MKFTRFNPSQSLLSLIVSCFILLTACSGDNTSDHSNAETGELHFTVVYHSDNAPQSGAKLDCIGEGVATVEAQVYGPDETHLKSGGPWDCDDGQGTITTVPAGNDRTVVILGKDSRGEVVFRGHRSGLQIDADSDNDVGTVDCYTFVPNLLTPDDGSNVDADTVRLSWNDVAGAMDYRVIVSVHDDLSNPLIDEITANAHFMPSGLSGNQTYYWQVTANDSYQNTGIGSNISSFTFTDGPVIGTPRQIFPENDTNVLADILTLTWYDAYAAVNYRILVSLDRENWDDPVIDVVTADLEMTTSSLASGTTYYWMVVAIGENDIIGGSSEIYSFTTTEVATLSSPRNNSEIPGTVIAVDWTAKGASEYRVVVSKNSNLSSPLIDKIVSELKCIVGYNPDVFYWCVYSRDDYGSESERSPIWAFTKKKTRQLETGLFFKTDGSLWQFSNFNSEPEKVLTDEPTETWKYIDVGYVGVTHVRFGIMNNDTLWGWGWNADGQVGVGSSDDRVNSPTLITTTDAPDTWECVSGGCKHAVAIKTDKSLWTWGNNDDGQLGNNSTVGSSTPIKVLTGTAPETWQYVSAGCSHTIGLKTDGTLWAWGNNDIGQIGDQSAPDGGSYHSNRLSPIQITTGESPETWKTISAGGDDDFTPPGITLGIKTDGSLWAWSWQDKDMEFRAWNQPYKIDDGPWKDIAAGGLYSLAIQNDGSLWQIYYSFDSAYAKDSLTLRDDSDTWIYASVTKDGSMMAFKEDGSCWRFSKQTQFISYDWFE
jgi:hypothetical protein